MDAVDRAQELEISHRQRALREAKTKQQPQKHNPNEQCLDCEEPIEAARLKALPCALRCISCQSKLERRQQTHSGSQHFA